jgi:hypothetical protein
MTHINVIETIDQGVNIMVHVNSLSTSKPAYATIEAKDGH